MVEMIEQLEQRHYAKHRYDDAMSSSPPDSYIDSPTVPRCSLSPQISPSSSNTAMPWTISCMRAT